MSCHKLNDVIVITWSNCAKWPSGRYILWPFSTEIFYRIY